MDGGSTFIILKKIPSQEVPLLILGSNSKELVEMCVCVYIDTHYSLNVEWFKFLSLNYELIYAFNIVMTRGGNDYEKFPIDWRVFPI